MKFENNWKHKTLDSLEKVNSEIIKDNSYLLMTCSKLRKKQLKDFSIEDLRIMIGQDIGLSFLIPLAIEVLEKNILAEGHLYEGDLLKMVLTSEIKYWKNNKLNWKVIYDLFIENKTKIEDFCYENSCKNEWLKEFKIFQKIN